MDWWSLNYRPVWLISNISLIFVVLLSWGFMAASHIRIDIPNIETKTKAIVAADTGGVKLRTTFGYKDGGVDFCTWAAAHKESLLAPFDAIDCTKKDQFTFKEFATVNVTNNTAHKEMNIWDVYQASELFDATHTKMLEPTDEYLKEHLANDGIYTGPKQCTKYLDKLHDSQEAFGALIIVFLVAHVVYVIMYNVKYFEQDNWRTGADVVVTFVYGSLYVYAIVMFITQRQSKVFTECSWLTKSFQQDQAMLWGTTLAYAILGGAGIIFILVFLYEISYVKRDDPQRKLGRFGVLFGVPGGYLPPGQESPI